MANLTLLLLLLLLFTTLQSQGAKEAGNATVEYVPVGTVEYRSLALATAAAYTPFQVCVGCRCCAAAKPSDCVATSCCYGINCNLPGKPFGVCAFTPKTCDCTNCTQS